MTRQELDEFLQVQDTTTETFINFKNAVIDGAGNIYVEKLIPSAQINNMGSFPVSLIGIGFSEYLDISKVVLEFTHNTTGHNVAAFDALALKMNSSTVYINKALISSDENKVAIWNGQKTSSITAIGGNDHEVIDLGDQGGDFLQLTTNNGSNPSTGDGEILVKILYNPRIFGPESTGK